MANESPAYRVLRTIGRVEIREYEPYLAAETVVDGSIESAGNRGFRTLAAFIFGRNTTTDEGPDRQRDHDRDDNAGHSATRR